MWHNEARNGFRRSRIQLYLSRESGGVGMNRSWIVLTVKASLCAALLTSGLLCSCSNQQAEQGNSAASVPPADSEASSVDESSSNAASSNSATGQDSSQSSAEKEAQLSPEQKAIKALDGWWSGWYHGPGYYAAYGNIHDSAIDWYYYNPDTSHVEYASTVGIVRADRFDENGATGWRFFPETAVGESFAYYQADGNENELPIFKTDLGYDVIDSSNYHTDSVERFGIVRIVDPNALDGDGVHSKAGFEEAQALAKERSAHLDSGDNEKDTGSSSAAGSSANQPFDQEKAEAEARDAAIAEGKQIFTGAVRVTTYADRAHEREPRMRDFDNNTQQLVLMEFESPVPTNAVSGDGAKHGAIVSGNSDSFRLPDSFAAYDGQTITIAAHENDMRTFSDTTGVLMSASVNAAEVIAPLTEADIKAKEAAASPEGYVFADSATRTYSRDELEALDNHTLFLARNELYARHGRGFKNQELRDYFASKSWYSETVAPESFNDDMLNETERANANLMLEIEQSRNSPYLN